jgi:hypothetical protein
LEKACLAFALTCEIRPSKILAETMSNGEKFPDTLPSAGIDAVEMRALVGFHDVAGDDACISKGTGAVLRRLAGAE